MKRSEFNQIMEDEFGPRAIKSVRFLRRVLEGDIKASIGQRIDIAKFSFEHMNGKPEQRQINLNIDAEVKARSDEEIYAAAAEIIRADPRFAHLLPGGSASNPIRSIEASGAVEARKPV